MNHIDYFIIIFYLLFTLIAGIFWGLKIKNIREYAVGERDFVTVALVMTICATTIGGSTIMASASEVYSVGIIDMCATMGIPIYNLIIAYLIAPRMQPFLGMISVGEVMFKLYGKSGRYITALAGVIVSFGFVAGQVKALAIFFGYFLEINVLGATLFSCFIVIAYSSFGGIRAVTFTDTIQFMILAISIPMIYNISLNIADGYVALFDKLPADHLAVINHPDFWSYFILFIFFAFPGLNPATIQRMLMAQDVEQITESFKIAAFILLPYLCFASMMGLIALVLKPDLTPANTFVFLLDTYTPPGIKGIAMIGMLAVVMSTADSYMNTAGVLFIHDFIKPIFGNYMPETTELKLTRWFTFFIGTLSTFIALSFDSLLQLVLFAQNFYIPIVTVPLMLGLFGFRSTEQVFIAGAIAGGSTFFLWQIYDLEQIFGFNSVMPGLLFNAVALLSTHYISKNDKSNNVQRQINDSHI